MYRIRFHGRGGQGMKTASRVLGTAFFEHGFFVQDAPRYGAERRGAPVFAYVRAAKHAINERGLITDPDLVVVADDSLVAVPAAGVMQGVSARTALLISTARSADTWRTRLNWPGPIIVLSRPSSGDDDYRFIGAACAGAAARLTGVISRESLLMAVAKEYAGMGPETVHMNNEIAATAYDTMSAHQSVLVEGSEVAASGPPPNWVAVPLDPGEVAAPAISAPLNSVQVRTGLWRSARPVIDHDRCHRCWWICSTFCPDNAIPVTGQGRPEIDYDHCKGCMICVAQCPSHAISVTPEADSSATAAVGAP
jgi:pyruvate ferredoxin oxidoreductase gamma subunit